MGPYQSNEKYVTVTMFLELHYLTALQCIVAVMVKSVTSFLFQVEFKDTNFEAFLNVLEYLYTGQCLSLSVDDIIGVLALANFFCLPRLVALCEQHIVKELQIAIATNEMAVAEDIVGKY